VLSLILHFGYVSASMQAARAGHGSTRRTVNAVVALGGAAALVGLSIAFPPTARAEGLDGAAVISDAVAHEIQHCNDWMSSHPDAASWYTTARIRIDDYCTCEGNLLIASAAPDEVVRLTIAGDLEQKLGQRRQAAGLYCIHKLLEKRTPVK
jgi:hypothetical protein